MDENHTLEYDIVASSSEAVTAIQQINQALITLRGTVQSVTGMFKKGLTIQVHGLENLDKMISGLRAVTPPTVNVDVDTTDATHTLDELQQRIKDINRDVLNNPTNGPPDTRGMRASEAIKQLQEYEKQQKKVKEAAAQINNPTNGKPDTRGMKAADAIQLLQAYDKQQKALKEAAAHAEQYSRQLDQVFNKLKVLDNAGKKHGGWDEWDTQKINEYITKARELINLLAQGGQNTGAAQTRLNELGQSISHTLNNAQPNNAGVKQAKNEWAGLQKTIKRVQVLIKVVGTTAKVVATAAKTIYKAFQKVFSVVKKIGSALANFVKHIAQFNKHSSKSGGIFSKLWNMFTKMALRKMIQAIFKDMQEGIDALARRSESFNAAFSKIKDAIYDIRNAVVSAIAPLVEIIEPLVSRLLGWITTGIDKIGQALAALNGQKTYKRLKQGATDYAKSLDKANKAQKQLVSGLDEINKLSDNEDDDDNPLGFYVEEKVIDKDISDIFAHIRDLWKGGKYRETGQFIAQQINGWVKGINLDQIQIKLTNFSDRIVAAINGFFAELDGKALGEKIGAALNIGLETINNFITGIHWDTAFGKASDVVKSFFETLNADKVATFVVGIANIIKSFLIAVFDVITSDEVTSKVSEISHKITDKLNEGLDNPEQRQRFTTSMGKAIGTVLNLFADFINNLHWDSIGEGIAEVIGTALETTDGGKLASAFGKITSAIMTIIEALPWQSVLEFIGDQLEPLVLILGDIVYRAISWAITQLLGGGSRVNKASTELIAGLQRYLGDDDATINALLDKGIAEYGKDRKTGKNVIAINDNGHKYSLARVAEEQGEQYAINWLKGLAGTLDDELNISIGDNTSASGSFHVGGLDTSGFVITNDDIFQIDWDAVDDVGVNVAEGVGEGITYTLPEVAGKFANELLTQMQDKTGIASPSTVMRDEVGIYLGEGIGDGIVQAIPYVIQCASRLMAAVRAVFGGTINYGIGIGTNYGVSALPGIASATIGQVNAGRFGGNGESYMGILSAMLNALQQHSDVYIDGRKVTDVVTQRQRLDAKATGRPVYMSY